MPKPNHQSSHAMTYRLRMLLGKWFIMVFNHDGELNLDETPPAFANINDARAHAETTGYKDGDR